MHNTIGNRSVNRLAVNELHRAARELFREDVLNTESSPVDNCVTCVTALLCNKRVEAAIAATMPESPRDHAQSLFLLSRRLKAIPETARADLQSLRPILERWHRLAGFADSFADTTWLAFQIGWPKVKCPFGVNVVNTALKKADAAPPLPDAKGYSPGMARLMAVCRQLGGDYGEFFISTRAAGQVMLDPERRGGHSAAMRGSRGLTMLEMDGWIVATERGKRGAGLATQFRLTDLWQDNNLETLECLVK